MNEFDLKQLKLIDKSILLFESGRLELFDFVNDLGGLLNALTSVDDLWKDDFQTEINFLEMIHDSIEDGSISKWTGDFKEDMHKSISKLKEMTTSFVMEYLKISDPNVCEIAIAENAKWLMCPKCNDAWESDALDAMVICPECNSVLQNPHVFKK